MLNGVPVLSLNGNTTQDVQGIAYSSKNVQSGFLFTALKGLKTNGYEFVEEALANGATAVLSDREKPKNFIKTWIQFCLNERIDTLDIGQWRLITYHIN